MSRIDVHVDWQGSTARVGTAYISARRGAVTTQFSYDDTWLARSDAWPISPDLPIDARQASTDGLPGAFADSAPDRWGRNLIEKRHRAQHRNDRTTLRTLTDVDFLLGVSDITRQGALRFTDPDGAGDFLQQGSEVPTMISLPSLFHAARQALSEDDGDDAVKLLLDAGTGSLGGARPKASVIDQGRLLIAKFPHPGDDWNVMAWEATALDIAALCGVSTPPHRLVTVGSHRVLLLERFDRSGERRVPYISAMTLTGSTDGGQADYLDVVEAFADHGSRVASDLRELFLRVAVSIAINNVDDHLRNHGFLWRTNGWELAPVFDVNPHPDIRARRFTAVAGATTRDEALTALIESADWFGHTRDAAARVIDAVHEQTRHWRTLASRNGVSNAELERFAAAFDTP